MMGVFSYVSGEINLFFRNKEFDNVFMYFMFVVFVVVLMSLLVVVYVDIVFFFFLMK